MVNNTDDFFQGKIKLYQPTYKATSDAVLLGASVVCPKKGRILDVGTGNGAIAVIAAFHNPLCEITGIDINSAEIENACQNAKINNLSIRFMVADIKKNPLKNEAFDIVVTNPPFFKNGTLSKGDTKKLAHHEGNISIAEWIKFCVRRTRYQGYIYIIIDDYRVSEVFTALGEKCGGITLFPLFSKKNETPKRFIIRARKESKEPFVLAGGLILHEENGKFTKDADTVLRDGNILNI